MLVSANTQYAAHQAYRMAKLADPREVDFLQVSDVAPGYVFLELEALGLYTRGESWQGVLDGRHALAGRYPTNTHGGSVAFGHASSASGLVNVVESVDQFLERAGERQIRGRPLRSCICQSSGGSQCNNVVAVLRSEA